MLEEELSLNREDIETFNNLKEAKNKLQEIREMNLKGALIRARVQILNLSENPTKFFLNLENDNFISKNIRELKLNDGSKVNKPDEILEEMWVFYSKLFNNYRDYRMNITYKLVSFTMITYLCLCVQYVYCLYIYVPFMSFMLFQKRKK